MLLSLTVAYLIGLVLGSYLPFLPVLTLLILGSTAIALTRLEGTGQLTIRRGLVLYAGLLAGVLCWTMAESGSAGRSLLGQAGEGPVRIVGTVVESVKHAPGRAVMVLAVSELGEGNEARPATGRLRLTWRGQDREVRLGDRLQFTAHLRAPSGTANPGGFDFAAYLKRRGIDAVASVSGPAQVTVLPPDPTGTGKIWVALWEQPQRVIDRWRERIRQAALTTLTGPALGIYLGIIIGEAGFVTPEVRDAFMATGTIHILSISGSHLGLIALLSFWLVRGTYRRLPTSWFLALSRRITPTRLAALVTTVPVTFYTLLAGAEVATVRSLVMILLFLLAVWLGHARDLLLALACAALLILVHDPGTLYDISFQLSYVSVLAIALVLRWLPPHFSLSPVPATGDGERDGVRGKLQAWLRDYLWITGAVTLATIPLVALYFNQIAWLGLIANLFVVPLAGLLLVPLGLGSAVWLLLTGGEALPAGLLNQVALDLLSQGVTWLAAIPGAVWHVASPTIPAIAVFYLVLCAAARPGDPSGLRRAQRWGGALGVVLLLGWWSWSPREFSDGETLRVTFLDVGQGDACLIELPNGETVLIDAGSVYDVLDMGRAVVGPYLWDRGIRRLDHVIGTHPQLDHVGGMPWVFRAFEVGRYWSNGIAREAAFYQRVQMAIGERGVREEIAEQDRVIIASGPCRLSVLNPPPARDSLRRSPDSRVAGSADRVPGFAGGELSGSALNNLSVVTRLDCGPHSFLFTADIETEALARLAAAPGSLGVRVLKVPHHGAQSSLSLEWIKAVRPEAAVISVGRHNPYGHPAASVLAAYNVQGVRVYRTDRDGAIWVTGSLGSRTLQIHTTRESRPRPVPLRPAMLATEFHNLALIWKQWARP